MPSNAIDPTSLGNLSNKDDILKDLVDYASKNTIREVGRAATQISRTTAIFSGGPQKLTI